MKQATYEELINMQ